MGDFEVRVNGRLHTLWETARYQRSIDNLCGSFSFDSTNKISDEYPVKLGDSVQIVINKMPVLTGFIDRFANVGSLEKSIIRLSGRCKTMDIVDSSVPDNSKNIEGPVSLKVLCETVISGLGLNIDVVNEVGTIPEFTVDDLQAGSSAENAFDFLNSFARKRQVYLITGGDGNLIIYRPGNKKSSTILRNEKNGQRNNVETWDCTNSHASRYNIYVARSQDNVGFNDASDYFGDGDSRNGTAEDTGIRQGRYLEIIGEESMDDSELSERASEESNIRRARSFNYKATVSETSQDNGELWDIGQIIPVRDFRCSISGMLLCRSLSMQNNVDSGSSTELNLTYLDAYKLNASLDQSDARRSTINRGFVK